MTEKAEQAYREYLSSLSIIDLRVLGREIGVRSSSSLNKQPLIEEIVGILLGVRQAAPPNRKGAPAKNVYLKPEILLRLDEIGDTHCAARREMKVASQDANLPQSGYRDTVYSGILLKGKEGLCACLHKDALFSPCVCLSSELTEKYSLQAGDEISFTLDGEKGEVSSVLTVNGRTEARRNPPFERLTAVYPARKFDFSESSSLLLRAIGVLAPIGAGSRVLVSYRSAEEKARLTRELVSHVRENGNVLPVVLTVDELPERIEEMKREVGKDNLFSGSVCEEPSEHFALAEWALLYAKRLVENGENVLFIADDFAALARVYDRSQAGGEKLFGGKGYCKRFFGAGRNVAEGGSLTMVGFLPVGEENSLLREVGNCFISFDEKSGKGCALDMERTFSQREETLLSEREYGLLTLLRERKIDFSGLESALKKTKNNRALLEEAEKFFKKKK